MCTYVGHGKRPLSDYRVGFPGGWVVTEFLSGVTLFLLQCIGWMNTVPDQLFLKCSQIADFSPPIIILYDWGYSLGHSFSRVKTK